jgi:hypothetical protein
MKKKPDQPFPVIDLQNSPDYPSRYVSKKKPFKHPSPPSEETVQRLNAIVKEAPFCFHFQARENDFL